MEWQHSGSPRPKKYRVQKSAGKFSPRFLGSRRHPPHWLSSKGPEYYSSLLVQLKDILKEKCRGKVTKMVLFLQDNGPGSPGTCNPEETGLNGLPMSWLPTLFSGPGPVGLSPVPWTEKNWKFAIFRPTRRSLLPRRPGWMDNFLNFFEWLAKIRATVQEVYCAPLGVGWINRSLVAVACFLPDRAKDLSAPHRSHTKQGRKPRSVWGISWHHRMCNVITEMLPKPRSL